MIKASYIDTICKHGADVLTGIRNTLTGDPWRPPTPAPTYRRAQPTTPPTSRTRRYPSMPAARDVNVYRAACQDLCRNPGRSPSKPKGRRGFLTVCVTRQ